MPTLSTIGAACAKAWGFTSGLVKDQYFNLVSLLLPGNGTNGAQNNTFLDSSTNNFTITRNGNTTQGTFSPFSQTGWGNYFDGTANGSLRADSTTDTNLSGDFTIQAWVFPTANGQSSNSEIISRGAATTLNGWHFGLVASTTQLYFGVNYASSGNTSTSTQSSTNISLNQWTHVAVTRSGNTCRIYINGVVDTTNTGFTGTPTVSGTEYVYVGRGSYDSTNRQFTGYINNASIIKGTALTTFSQTQPLATGTSGQALLTCTANRFIDTNTATTAKTLTAGSGASVVAFSPFAPTAAYTTAAVGGSGYFDGTGDYLTAPGNTAFDLGSGDFTIEAWIYTQGSGSRRFIDYANGTATNANFSFSMLVTSGNVAYGSVVIGSTVYAVTGTTTVTNTWTHVALVRNGTASGNLKLYVNGVAEGTAASLGSTAINTLTGTPYLSISSYYNGGGELFNGYVSSARIIKGTALYTGNFTPPTAPFTAVSGTSLLLNFTNAGITDATAKNDLETVGNAQISTSVSKFGGGSIYLDGTSDYLSIPQTVTLAYGTGNFTVEFWLYRAGNVTVSDCGVIDQRDGGSGAYFMCGINTSQQFFVFLNSAYRIGPSASTLINQNTWYHIAYVRSSTTGTLYINGSSVGSWADNLNYVTNKTLIGRHSGGGTDFNGYLDDIRITNGYARYTSNFTPPSAPFPVQ